MDLLLFFGIIVVGLWVAGIPFVVNDMRKSRAVRLSDLSVALCVGIFGIVIMLWKLTDGLDSFLQKIHLPHFPKLSDPIIFKKKEA